MNRLLLRPARVQLLTKNLVPLSLERSALQASSHRFYSNQGTGKGPQNRGKILLALGILAVGSTLLSISYQRGGPVELIEPSAPKAFKDGEVSVVFVLGGPGAGKGTQCAKLVKDYGFVHLSAGDLLRAEQARPGSQYGELIAKYIREGTIVPQEVTVALLKNAMKESYAKGSTRFLVDGFPRKMDQALTFENEIATSSFVLFFDCPEDVMEARLLERGKSSGRADDNVESIKKRFKTFTETSYPVVEYYEKQGKVARVSSAQPADKVYSEVQKVIKERIKVDSK